MTDPHHHPLGNQPGGNSLVAFYDQTIAKRGYRPDPAQRYAVERLQRLVDALGSWSATEVPAPHAVADSRSGKASGWRSLLGKWLGGTQRADSPASPSVALPKSLYLWGGVGRGKSFVMDLFYAHVPVAAKRRVHFHAFMQEVHERLQAFKNQSDPLCSVAQAILSQARLICFDEFHVSDIADAMILGRLLDALWANGAVLVMTSNYHPDGLYPNGLMRINFLPTIERIKAMCEVIEVDGGTDYRLRTLTQTPLYRVVNGRNDQTLLATTFTELTGQLPQPGSLMIHHRSLPYLGCADGVLWCDFAALCNAPRNQADYLVLAKEFHTLLISAIPRMGPEQASSARRFTWLVDVCYDHRVKLVATAKAEPYDLYPEGLNAHEFARTVSRLLEMRTHEYLALAHRSD